MPCLLASDRAPKQEGDALTSSALLLQAPRLPPPLATSPSKNSVVFAPTENNPRHRPPKTHQCSVRDPKILTGSRPTKQRYFLPAVSSLRGFRTPAPRQAPAPAKGRRPNPSYEGPEVNRQLLVSVNSDLSDRVNSLPTSYPVGFCDP
jgi:hypothetical protein